MIDESKVTEGEPDSRFKLYRVFDLTDKKYLDGFNTIDEYTAKLWVKANIPYREVRIFTMTIGSYEVL